MCLFKVIFNGNKVPVFEKDPTFPHYVRLPDANTSIFHTRSITLPWIRTD